MAKVKLIDMVIEEIPKEEMILKEGVVRTITIVSGKRRSFVYKYALTDRGVWMRSNGFLWIKGKTSSIAYSDIECFKPAKLFAADSVMFFLKSGKRLRTHIVFDDMPGAIEILSRYIRYEQK